MGVLSPVSCNLEYSHLQASLRIRRHSDAMLAELENETVAESDGGGGGSGSEATYDGTVDTSGLIDDDLLLEREDDD